MFVKDCAVPRPSIQDPVIARLTAEKLYEELDKQQLLDVDIEKDQCIAELVDALQDVSYLDGFELAKFLTDKYSWEGNFSLCEALDHADGWARKFVNEQTKLWVAQNNIEPKLKDGAIVEHLKKTMVVVGFRKDEAKYELVAPSKSETPEAVRHVKYEDIEAP
jgi:hypothetical protein